MFTEATFHKVSKGLKHAKQLMVLVAVWSLYEVVARRKQDRTSHHISVSDHHTQETGRGETDPLRPGSCRCTTAETSWNALCDPLPKPKIIN